jgi:hypothetical protein
MTYFPQNPPKRYLAPSGTVRASVQPALLRDVLWNQPVFKAPALSNPDVAVEPLPFTAARITRRRRSA